MTNPLSVKQWRGLVALTQDAVVETSCAVERAHRHTARWSFDVLERVPVVAIPASIVRRLHDTVLVSVHMLIRLTAHAAGGALGAALEGVEERTSDRSPPQSRERAETRTLPP